MENLIIYLVIAVVVACITTFVCFNLAYKNGKLKAAFNQKVKELDAKDNTINSQKAELSNRKEEIEKKKKEIQKLNDELELVKAGLESCREDKERREKQLRDYQPESKTQVDAIVELNKEVVEAKQKITTLEEENQQLLTQLNTKKNGKRNPKN